MVVVRKKGLKAGGWQIVSCGLGAGNAEAWRITVMKTPYIMLLFFILCVLRSGISV